MNRSLAMRMHILQKTAKKADLAIDGIVINLNKAKPKFSNVMLFKDRVLNDKHPSEKKLKELFSKALAPLNSAMMNAILEFTQVLTKTQLKELCGIGKTLIHLLFAILSGKLSLENGLKVTAKSLLALRRFFKKNPEIALKIGAKILNAIHPVSHFIVNTLRNLEQSKIENAHKAKLCAGFKALLNALQKLENELSQMAKLSASLRQNKNSI